MLKHMSLFGSISECHGNLPCDDVTQVWESVHATATRQSSVMSSATHPYLELTAQCNGMDLQQQQQAEAQLDQVVWYELPPPPPPLAPLWSQHQHNPGRLVGHVDKGEGAMRVK